MIVTQGRADVLSVLSSAEPALSQSFVTALEAVVRKSLDSLISPLERFLRDIGMQKHYNTFVENDINMNILPLFTEVELRTIIPMGAAKKISLELQKLRQ